MDPVFQHLSGITIQRLEKPKSKPESQNPPSAIASEAESSFDTDEEEEEEESSDDAFEPSNISKRIIDTSEVPNLKRNLDESITIDKRVIDTTKVQNFKRNVGDSVRIEKPTISKRVIDATEVQNLKLGLDDSVSIDRSTTFGKRVLDAREVQNFKRNLDDSITIDRSSVNKRVLNASDAQNFRRGLQDSVTIDRATLGKRVIDASEVQNYKRNLEDSLTVDRSSSGKRVIDSSELHNFTRNLGDSVRIDSFPVNKRVVAPPEVQSFKQNLDNSITLDRPAGNKRILDTSELQNFKGNLDDSVTFGNRRILNVPEATNLKRNLNDAATIERSTVAKRVVDSSELQNLKQNFGDGIRIENVNESTIDRQAVSKRVLDSTGLQNFKQGFDDSVTINKSTVSKSGLDSTQIQNFKQNLSDSVTIDRPKVTKRVTDSSEVHNFKRGLDDSITLDRPAVSKRVTDFTEAQSYKRNLDDSVTVAKRVIGSTEVQNFKRGLDDSVTIDRPIAAKRVIDSSELQSLKRNLGDSIKVDRPAVSKRVLNSADIYNLKRSFDNSVTIDRPTSSKRVLDSNEAQTFRQSLNDSVTLDSFPVSKRVIDSKEARTFRQNLDDSVMLDSLPIGKRVIDSKEARTFKPNLDDSVTLGSLPASKRVVDSTEVQRLSRPSEDNSPNLNSRSSEDFVAANTAAANATRVETPNFKDFEKIDNSVANKRIDSAESQTYKRSLDDPVASDSLPKKIKTTQSEILLSDKSKTNTSGPGTNTSLSDVPTDEEISEYASESDFESETELDSEIAAIKREAAASFNKETKIETGDPTFLENLVEDSFLDKTVPDIVIKTETDSCDADDYDYDIKEKLKEMGEISFETVKKGDKSKKTDTENETTVVKTNIEDDVVIERKGPGGGIIASSMMRRNIREVMDEAKLDEATLAAQREEMERLQRVQEQQRIIREVQRQMAQERMQNKVLSLLQGGSLSKAGSSSTRIGNTVLVKLPNGETKSVTKVPKQQPFDLVKLPKGQPSLQKPPQGSITSVKKSPASGSGPGQLTPSVSIAPVSKKLLPPSLLYSDSEGEYEDSRMQRPYPRGRAPKPSTLTTVDPTSDDDCIVVSDTEGELDDEIIEDPSNSGMHTNDEFNQPDEQGRVVVNIGHPEGEPELYLAPQIARIIKPHQIGGVRFLYDNVIESINRFDSSTGFGCILAHSMGLGKTLQVVCFSDVFLRHTSAKTILCIMPINTLQNWLAEYNMWIPAEEDAADNPLSAHGEVRPRTFSLYVLNDSHKTIASRSRVVQAWRSSGGVLLIGYEQYRLLSLRKQPKSRRKPVIQPEDEDKNRKLMDDIHSALVMPGPDLVICDEGHRIKNSHASISQALKQMRTKRRVVLTGYPLQNNLMEYWCMVDFVRPNYLGSKAEFCNMFERPIQNGQCMDSTETDIKLMRYRAHVLHSLLVGFVQRRSHAVLQNALPQKEEYVLLLRMTDFQRRLYNVFMNEVVRCQSVPNPLKAFAVCCKIWNHPDVLYNFLKKRAGGEAVDIDLEEVSNTSSTIVNGPASKPKRQPRRSTTPKGRRNTKPAASVTPNNTREEEKTPPRTTRRSNFISPNPVPDTSEFFHNENANFPSPSVNNQQGASSTYFSSGQSSETNNQPSFSNQNFSQSGPTSFSNFSSNTSQASSSNSFQNIKQQLSLWGQKDLNEQCSNFSKNLALGGDMFSTSTNSREGTSWRKDDKSIVSNNIITSPIKSELGSYSGSENKPKITIISDIKLGSSFSSPLGKSTPDSKKINIISDIKLEIKKEESGDDKRFSKFNMESMKNEIKPLMKPEQPSRRISEDEDVKIISEMPPPAKMRSDDGQDGIPYDWAIELLKDYIPGCIEYSAKTDVLFCIIRESIALGDRLLLFSQSLITLDVIEQFLQTNNVPRETEKWAKNTNYYRLDGSTSALEREKLINEFNSNPKIHLFLVSTRAGSLGINLVGANRVVVFDASWNPCHDTQAVCRVYRYGQRKPCFVYRFVMDHCLEKKIYDRQINKQGMSDRVVDECNPDSHVTMKDLSTLCFDDTDEGEAKDWSCVKDKYIDTVLQKVLEKYGTCFSKQPFQHESLLVDRKDKQLSQQEKRLAKKGYEREKQASRQPTYNPATGARSHRPVASVRPMLQGGERPSRWIPAEHWQRQGMTAQEMTLPLDVVIPTNQPDKSNIILKAGQKVLVLKSPKGVYMQLENGKIVAIKTAIKVRGKAEDDAQKIMKPTFPPMKPPPPPLPPPNMPLLPPPKRMVRPFTPGHAKLNMRSVRQPVPNLVARMQGPPRMQGPRKPGPLPKGPSYPMGTESLRPTLSSKPDMDSKKIPVPSEITQRLMGDEITMEKFTTKNERRSQTKVELPEHSSLLKSIQQRGAISISSQKSRGSTIQQLEQSTSALLSDTKQRIQDISEIASSFHEEEKASVSDSSSVAHIESDDMQDPDDVEDIEDLDESYEDEELIEATSDMTTDETETKGDGSQGQDYNYNGYYGYNQPYPHPPYGSYPPHQPPYDYAYGTPQQPPYNYGAYPQGYHPPQPQYPMPPPQPYDPYVPHPPQPMYPGYHPPYPQQYPPPPGPYPPPAAPPPPHNYPDYQYNTATTSASQNPSQSTSSSYYQNT